MALRRILRVEAALLAALLILLLIFTFLAQGHAPARWPQLLLLAAPGVVLVMLPIQSRRMHLLRLAFVLAWTLAFVFDGAIRAFLGTAYQAAPDSSLVIGAVANTNTREGVEYLRSIGPSIVLWPIALLATVAATVYLSTYSARSPKPLSRLFIGSIVTLLVLSILAYALKPSRKLHPAIFWTSWTKSVLKTQHAWAHLQLQREEAQAYANLLRPQIDTLGSATIVLVISDSVNRDNLGLYGYSRETTPALLGLKNQLGDHMLVLKNAWAVEASTLPALNKMLTLNSASGADSKTAHIIAMAKAAGYRTWWISNHDDMAIEQQHAKFADVVDIVNRIPGRSGGSLDSELLDCFQEALDEPHQRKFIVVHLMGAHPHYGLRYPTNQNPFPKYQDAIDISLAKQGRSAWIRHLREEYDAAILFHDHVVSQIFQMTKASNPPRSDEYRAWMYLSDHGQEVGHTRDFAGHSPNTAAGYRIPVMIWRNNEWPASPDLARNTFRSDWTSWTLADLLNLQWEGYRPSHNILSANYEWHPPSLPIPVTSYTE